MRRSILAISMAIGFFILGTGVAQAWDLVHDRSGTDRVVVRAWTRNYNQVAYVADHAGTRVDVFVRVTCNNGDTFTDTWVDGGQRFRFVLSGLGNSGRCDHVFRVDGRNANVVMDLALYARG